MHELIRHLIRAWNKRLHGIVVYYKNKAVREQEFTLLEVAISWGICNELNTNWFDYYVSLLLEENVATQSNLCHQQIRETFSCIYWANWFHTTRRFKSNYELVIRPNSMLQVILRRTTRLNDNNKFNQPVYINFMYACQLKVEIIECECTVIAFIWSKEKKKQKYNNRV